VNSEPLTLTQRTAVPLSSELASLARSLESFLYLKVRSSNPISHHKRFILE
jgi:hypothetical protein